MPLDYAANFGRLGERAGAGIGALGGAGAAGGASWLANLLEPLDYVRQAAWNLVRKPFQAMDEGNPSHLLGMLPGLAGLAGTAIGGPWGGILGAGLAQGLGKSVDDERFQAPEVSDLTGTEDILPNMLVGALTDPSSYIGIGLGKRFGAGVGKKLGQEFGTGLEAAARARGPRYPGGLEKLADVEKIAADPMSGSLLGHIEAMKANPAVLAELPEGSKYLGHGVQTVAFKRPDVGVTTFSREAANQGIGPRLDIPEILQASRSIFYPEQLPSENIIDFLKKQNVPSSVSDLVGNSMRVEHSPLLEVLKKSPHESLEAFQARQAALYQEANTMADQLAKRGQLFWDSHLGNIGKSPEGKTFIIDPGAVYPELVDPADAVRFLRKMRRGEPVPTEMGILGSLPRAPEISAHPGWLKNKLLDWLGADQAVRNELSESLRQYRGGRPLSGEPLRNLEQILMERLAPTGG